MCECDGLCKLDKEELLALLRVRLSRLSVSDLQTLNQFVFQMKQNASKEMKLGHWYHMSRWPANELDQARLD